MNNDKYYIDKKHLMVSIAIIITIIALIGMFLFFRSSAYNTNNIKPATIEAKEGNTVLVDYIGTLTNGTEFDSSIGKEPLRVTLGSGQVIPGFEEAIIGMKINDTKTITLPVDEAYGEKSPEFIITINRSKIQGNISVGDQIVQTLSNGYIAPGTIIELNNDTVTVDFNHPLAGQDLIFEITLVDIEN